MYLTWYGQSCFKIQSKEKNVLINPFSPKEAGLRGPNFKAEIVVLSNPADYERAVQAFPPETFLIYSPGEYEISNLMIDGINCADKNKKTFILRFEIEKIKIGFLAEINRPLKEEEMEKLNGIDLLLLPVGGPSPRRSGSGHAGGPSPRRSGSGHAGGQTVLKAEESVKIVSQLEPKMVIPYYYRISGLKSSSNQKLDSLDKFLHQLGLKPNQATEKLKINVRDLAGSKKTELITLTPKVL